MALEKPENVIYNGQQQRYPEKLVDTKYTEEVIDSIFY